MKNELIKINNEYKVLKDLQFAFYFKINKVKVFFTGILSFIFLVFSVLFGRFFKNLYLSNTLSEYNDFFVYLIFCICFFVPVFISFSFFYISIYSFFQFLKKRKQLNKVSCFNCFDSYIQCLESKKEKAAIILKGVLSEK